MAKIDKSDRNFDVENQEENVLLKFRYLFRNEQWIMDVFAYELPDEEGIGVYLRDVPFMTCESLEDGYQQIIASLIRENVELRKKIELVKSTVKDL